MYECLIILVIGRGEIISHVLDGCFVFLKYVNFVLLIIRWVNELLYYFMGEIFNKEKYSLE
ncbi:hypothetical protein SOASR030_27900 [Leminorella grimontii]|uniref:Uncharacterized protein n=1 Tax=Leminorella grimontii TaxID=82981 RepID=A0AAV5N731_9GAMM|nr:hypothetical protein SOASR030_27900 [Leminorella grimontii]GKX59721.1 hypothetical protein SOASR031_20360 [Leminorella grimontii]